MAQRMLALVAFGLLLIGTEGRGRGPRGQRRQSRSSSGHGGQRTPQPVVFHHSTELNATSFKEMVVDVANSSSGTKQAYFSFVMFHVSWCQHCQQTLPEFERAAAMVNKSASEGQLKGLTSPVKFFLLNCDKPDESVICDRHKEGGLPTLKLFRDQRAFPFKSGARWANTLAEWSVHVSRPPILQIETKADLDKYKTIGVLFMMKDEAAKEQALVKAWLNLAYELIEDVFFCVVPAHSEAAAVMPPGPSVSAYGKDVEVMPFPITKMDERSLKEWVNFNRWPVVTAMTPEVGVKLMRSGIMVVIFAYRSVRGVKADAAQEAFRLKASEIRSTGPAGKYIFAAIDTTTRENGNFVSRVFPAVSVPSVFLLSGNMTYKSDILYWETPSLTDASSLTPELLEELQANDWARQDNSTASSAKAWGKWGYRFGTGSVLGVFVVIVVPTALLLLFCVCLRELWTSDDEAGEKTVQALAKQMAKRKLDEKLAVQELQEKRAARAQAELDAKKKTAQELQAKEKEREDHDKAD